MGAIDDAVFDARSGGTACTSAAGGPPRAQAGSLCASALSSAVVGSIGRPLRDSLRRIQASGIGRNH
jgi:hypothetical protein